MTKAEILELVNDLIDDEFGSTEDVYLNIAYHEVLSYFAWLFLVKWAVLVSAGNYSYILPADFGATISDKDGHGHLFVGTENNKYTEISILDKLEYQNITGYFYIDRADNLLVFTGVPSISGSVNLPYAYEPDDMADDTDEPCAGFKKAYHPAIAYKMASLFPVTEQEEKARSYRNEYAAEYQNLLELMMLDDARARERARN